MVAHLYYVFCLYIWLCLCVSVLTSTSLPASNGASRHSSLLCVRSLLARLLVFSCFRPCCLLSSLLRMLFICRLLSAMTCGTCWQRRQRRRRHCSARPFNFALVYVNVYMSVYVRVVLWSHFKIIVTRMSC